MEKPETQNRRLVPTGLAKPGETRGLTGTVPGLDRQEAAGRVYGPFWNASAPFFQSNPGPMAGYPDLLLTPVRVSVAFGLSFNLDIYPRGWRAVGGKHRHLAGLPGGGGGFQVLSYFN